MYFHPFTQETASRHYSKHECKGPAAHMNHVLLPVESLQTAKHALDYVIAKNKYEPLWIHLLNVQPPIKAGEVTHFHTTEMIMSARQAAGAEVLRSVQRLLEANGVAYTARIVLGEAAETIARFAAEKGCTSIVMGTRGRSPIGTFILGSVATRVVNLTEIPVTLIKQAREANVAALLRRTFPEQYAERRHRRMETQDVVQGP
jgi:nucleotide-binding universal stress UspA family protein